MLPGATLSSKPKPAPFLYPDAHVVSPLQDFELGGVALNDPSLGLEYTWWVAYVEFGDEGADDKVFIRSANGDPVLIHEGPNITEVALAFDSNMREQVAWTEDGLCRFRWYDTQQNLQVITDYPQADNLRLGLDDKREAQGARRDVILAYTRDGNLCIRAQRDRYNTEYVLRRVGPGRLLRVGMNEGLRFQFQFDPEVRNDDPDWPSHQDTWSIPLDAGFSPGEMVGLWAKNWGFLGFRQIEYREYRTGPRLVVHVDAPGEDRIIAGYPYNARYQPLPLSQPDERGAILGRKRRLVRAILSVEDAANLMVNEIPALPETGEDMSHEHTARSGEFEVRMLGWTTGDEVVVEAVSPYSAIVRALIREYNQ